MNSKLPPEMLVPASVADSTPTANLDARGTSFAGAGTMTPTARSITQEVLAIARQVQASQPDVTPVAVWDFDGTLLRGDCSEGYRPTSEAGYAGLAEIAIYRKLSERYHPGQMQHCWQEYRMVAARHGKAAAHSFLVQAFAGAKESELLALSREHFEQTLGRWLFSDGVQTLRSLESNGVRCVVISASADFFVKGAAAVLPLAECRIHGIRLGRRDDGRLSHDVVAPVTSGEGKVGRMWEVMKEMAAEEPGRSFLPVLAIGDSLETDGAMLEAVARNPLPVGTPLSLIVNGGGSAASRGHRFREISFQTTLGLELVNL